MSEWSLPKLFESLHKKVALELDVARQSIEHPGTKGTESENVWLKLFQLYLPKRYQAEEAFVVDSNGKFSQQIDIVIFDRQYSPFVFHFDSVNIIPIESVYAVFEVKQAISAANIEYAIEKIDSVRKLHPTSLPIPHAGGTYPAKKPIEILGGLLTLDSDWSPALGRTLQDHLEKANAIDIGCVAQSGFYYQNRESKTYEVMETDKAATAFLFKLISLLQESGTVPMIDVLEYSKFIDKKN